MKPIGGYFEWEFPINNCSFPHSNGILLNSGRHSLEYILRSIGRVNHIWIPFYTCDVVLQPIQRLGISYSFYHVNQDLTLSENVILGDNDYLIYNNYFGIMDEYCKKLAIRYGGNLILDYAQAFFAPDLEGINTFYSPRKFIGIPDGGVAYTNLPLSLEIKQDQSYDRCAHLLKRHELAPIEGYKDFKESSYQIANSPLSLMSNLTQKILLSLDYIAIKEKRLSNFTYLHAHLADLNLLQIPLWESFSCPMVYPFMSDDRTLRTRLIDNQVFVATYWPNVLEWCKNGDTENNLCRNIIPIPIDQRYGEAEMKKIIKIVKNY